MSVLDGRTLCLQFELDSITKAIYRSSNHGLWSTNLSFSCSWGHYMYSGTVKLTFEGHYKYSGTVEANHPASLGVSQVMRERVADMIVSNTLTLQGRTRYVARDHISNTLSHHLWIRYFSLSFFLDFSTFVSSKAFLPSDVSVFFATHK